MKPKNFITSISSWFETWLKSINSKIKDGTLKISGDFSFPSFLRVGESPHHYIAELSGATNIDSKNKYGIRIPLVTEKVRNTASFLNPGLKVSNNATGTFTVSASENSLVNLAFANRLDLDEFAKKINVTINSAQIQFPKAEVPIIVSEHGDKLLLRDIDLIRTQELQIFFKRIPTAIIVRKNIDRDELFAWLNKIAQESIHRPIAPDILGLNLGYTSTEESFALSLLSLTQQSVNESIIDRFIQKNKSYFSKTLGYKDAISQPRLQIINSTGLSGEYLQPDYLMLREDGGYDILDLKKALIPSVTIGRQSRLRFSAYVTELIGQLEGYKRYFSLKENQAWAKKELGVNVSHDLRLLGIVGNHNNFLRQQVDLALTANKEHITILSYSEIINLLRK